MGITRAQQVRQMLNGGGAPSNRGDIGGNQPSRGESLHGGESVRDSVRRGELKALAKTGPGSDLETGRGRENLEALEALSVQGSNFPGLIGLGLNVFKGPRQKLLRRNVDFFKNDPRTKKAREKYGLTVKGYQDYMKDRSAGNIDAAGNPINDDDDDDNNIILPIIPQPISNMTADAADADADAEEKENTGRMFRLLADGGMTEDAPVGGIMDIETGRQMYGLGKLVKKATRAVKKIAKSPVGKAALLYAGAGGLGNLAAGKGFGSMFSNFLSPSKFLSTVPGIFTKGGLQNIASRIGLGGFENIGGERIFQANKLGSFLGSPTGIITAVSLLPLLGIGTGDESEEEAQELLRGEGIDIAAIRANPNQFTARRFAAEGGSMKEPVAKKTMPLIDMDGKEKDYRETGGFVDMGRMERADDVPARLSKNEFVFTADAVRNAGDGSVDKGAEVMYNMMKNLEAGGDVSEESQGLDGAREMFQTSQRLGEVL